MRNYERNIPSIKSIFNKACDGSRNRSPYSDEETGSAVGGCSTPPISSGPSQCYYSPLRERVWQSADGDFSKLLSCWPHALKHSEPVPRNKVSRDTPSVTRRSMWYITDAFGYPMQVAVIYKFSTRIRNSTAHLQNLHTPPANRHFSKHAT